MHSNKTAEKTEYDVAKEYIYSHCLVISDIYVLSYTIGYKII